MIPCPDATQWQAVLAQQLTHAEEELMDIHADGCLSCQRLLQTLTNPQDLSMARLAQSAQSTLLADRGLVATPPQGNGLAPNPFHTLSFSVAERLAEPPVVPGYEILEELGRGGMGVVFKARQVELNRIVALKMLLGSALADPGLLARFRDEAKAVARCQHPGIVQIHEIGTLEGRPFLALEYVPGSSLDRVLQGKPQPPREAAALLVPLADAMHAAHQQGIIHRDLKPANVLLAQKSQNSKDKSQTKSKEQNPTRNGFDISDLDFVCDLSFEFSDFLPKVTDFGLAKPLDEDSGRTETGIVVGTPSYMAPEQAAGGKTVGPATDIYALGAILYEMLTGRPPFKGVTAYDTIHLVLHEEPVPPCYLQPAIPRDLETICLKCLHKEPARRYLTAQDLAEDLGRFLAGRPVTARPVGRAERTWRWCRRNPVVAGLWATVVLVLLAASAAGWFLAAWALRAEETARHEGQRATEQRDVAVREQQRAETNFTRAEANFALARNAVNDSFLICRNHELFQGDVMEPQRHLLLGQALPFYRDLARQKSDDPAVLREQLDILNNLAFIYKEVGPREQAVAAYQEALAIAQKLLSLEPRPRAYRILIAGLWNNLATVQRDLSQRQAATASAQQSLLWAEPLVAEQPAEPVGLDALATAWHTRALVHIDAGQLQPAIDCLAKAVRLRSQLVQAQPQQRSHQEELANLRNSLARAQEGVQKWREALENYTHARQLLENLVTALPDHLTHQLKLGGICNNLGVLHLQQGRTREAAACFARTAQLYQKLVEARPKSLLYAASLGSSQSNLGMLETFQGRYREALPHYARAARTLREVLRREPQDASAREYLRNTLIQRGIVLATLGRRLASCRDFQEALLLDKGSRQRPAIQQYLTEMRPHARTELAWLAAVAHTLVSRGGTPAPLAGELVPWMLWIAPEPEQ